MGQVSASAHTHLKVYAIKTQILIFLHFLNMWAKIEMDSGNKFHIINSIVENLGDYSKQLASD